VDISACDLFNLTIRQGLIMPQTSDDSLFALCTTIEGHLVALQNALPAQLYAPLDRALVNRMQINR